MKRFLLLGVSTLLFSTSLYAADLKVGGYANVWVPLMHDNATKELETSATAEADFEATSGKTSVRVDLDFPSSGTEAQGISAPIEQAKVTHGLTDTLSFTAGAFNTPMGFEKQDAPDKLQFSNGQLFGLRPANVAGVMGSWKSGATALDVYVANDWRGQALSQTGYDNSVGAHFGWSDKMVGLDLGYITSDRLPGKGVADIVLSTGIVPHTDLVLEYLKDKTVHGWGITAHHAHEAHGVTVRYDSVDTSASAKATSLTLALSCKIMEAVTTNLEWRMDKTTGQKSSDMLVLQWVAPF